MPEIGEIARLVHFIRKHLVGRTIAKCRAYPDDIVYGKVGCSADAFERAVTGRRVIGADQQGKYFYMLFDRPPHAVMHCGMTGWLKVDVEDTTYYPNAKEKKADQGWPPKYVKFLLSCAPETVNGVERGAVEAAFVDPRRLARIRLVHCEADRIRQETPLKENGPDPVRDRHLVTVEWLEKLLGRKHVPVKALLLDQANLSGVGNWVADEVLYQARIHPEQYTDTMFTSQIQQLHDSLINVCTTAVDTLADSTKFPENWIMKYRWDKGKKDANVLPNGEKIVHIKVGGRTSAIVPTVQRKGEGKERGTKRKAESEEGKEEGGGESDGAKKEDEEEAKPNVASDAKRARRSTRKM